MIGQFKTLIIHSDTETNNKIKEYLVEKEHVCYQIYQVKELENYSKNQTFDCIIIEDDFPKIKLNELVVHFKLQYNPIIIVLSHTLASDYLEKLLNIGVDDYITEPFHIHDIYSKIQSIYKNGVLKPRRIYRFKDISLDITAHTCSCNEKPLNLTKNEFKLLSILISHPYQPFSITYLFEEVWGSSIYEDGTSIPALINSLMIKLRQANNEQEYIKRFGKDYYKMAF